MLTLLPALILLVTALAVIVIHRMRPNLGVAWFLSVTATVVSLGLFIFYHWHTPGGLIFDHWLPVTAESPQILFQLDAVSWSYGISLLSLLLAILLTAPVRLQYKSNPITWAGNLGIAGAALLGVLSASPLTLVLTWTILDLLDLITTLSYSTGSRTSRSAIVLFLFRLAGTFLVFWAMGLSRVYGAELQFESADPRAAFFLLLAVGLRLGVLPLALPFSQEVLRRRGIGTMLRLAAPASSLGVIAHLSSTIVPTSISRLLLALVGLSVIYGAWMWLSADDEVEGRQYWILALAGMAVGSAIRGQPQASLAWGVAMILSGGLLFLYSTRPRMAIFLPALGLLGLTGLPFTPAASGWKGLIVLPFTLPDLFFLVAQSLLLLGYLRHFLRPGDAPSEVERWQQVTYYQGLMILILSGWMIGIFGFAGSFSIGYWWASMIPALVVLLSVGMYLFLKRKGFKLNQLQGSWLVKVGSRAVGMLTSILRLNWLYALFWQVFTWLGRLVQLVTNMLEGAGGVLWVFVLLVLIITFLQVGAP